MTRRPALGWPTAVVVTLLLAFSQVALGQPTYPMPGGALGSDTGDSSSVYTGLAISPHANLFTGVASTKVGIELPPGRGRATPKVELTYSSSRGSSAYGYGWDLPLTRISRSTQQGVPRYDETDTFVLEMNGGSMELVPVAGSKLFVAKVEGAFLRIGFERSENRWKVIDRSGTTFRFGLTETGRRALVGHGFRG